MILEAVSDRLLVPLHSIVVNVNHALEALQCHEADIVLPVHEEPAKDVDAQDSQAGACFNPHDGADALGEDGVARVLGRFSVGCNLG